MIKIAIVEDVKEMSDVLNNYLDAYAVASKESFLKKTFRNPTDFLVEAYGYDVVFMDIDFKNDMNGLEAAKKLRIRDKKITIVFVTAFKQFAIKGYEVEAFDFIVKPIEYVDFCLRFNRLLNHVKQAESDFLDVRTQGATKVISLRDVKYIEVTGHSLTYHTTEGNLQGPGNLSHLETSLYDKNFIRCNHCYLVNLRYVTEINGLTIKIGKDTLAISRPKKDKFLSALNKYLGK